jgi:hypothetical protein
LVADCTAHHYHGPLLASVRQIVDFFAHDKGRRQNYLIYGVGGIVSIKISSEGVHRRSGEVEVNRSGQIKARLIDSCIPLSGET